MKVRVWVCVCVGWGGVLGGMRARVCVRAGVCVCVCVGVFVCFCLFVLEEGQINVNDLLLWGGYD